LCEGQRLFSFPRVVHEVVGAENKRFGPGVHDPRAAGTGETPSALRLRNELGDEVSDDDRHSVLGKVDWLSGVSGIDTVVPSNR